VGGLLGEIYRGGLDHLFQQGMETGGAEKVLLAALE